MADIDKIMDKLVEEFSEFYKEKREQSIVGHVDRKDKNPYGDYPKDFWSESDLQYWFIEKLKKNLNPTLYKFHTEVTINNSIFDEERIKKLTKEIHGGWRVDLGIFQNDFESTKLSARKAMLLVEFKYELYVNTKWIGKNRIKEEVSSIKEKEIKKLKAAINAGLTERSMLICVNEGIFEFDQEKEITNKIKDEVDNKRFDLKIIGTTLEARKNWAKT